MSATCPAPGCGAAVLEARDLNGALFFLNPGGYGAGKFYVLTEDGIPRVRPVIAGRPLPEGAKRYSAHTCKKLAPVREAQARDAAAARNRSHQYKPKDRSPFAGAAGVRIMPPGGER